MNPFLARVLLAACLLAGCAPAHRIPAEPPAAGRPAPDELRTVAYRWFAREDYVRALRFAYRGARLAPSDPRFPLLLALTYDLGLDRPDLALPEYRRALLLRPWMDLSGAIVRRMHYLNRQAVLQRVDLSFVQPATRPFSEDRVAVYPLAHAGPRTPEPGLSTGLTALLAHAVCAVADTTGPDPLDLLLVSHEFVQRLPLASPGDFARWSGAGGALSGNLIDLGGGRLRIELHLLNGEAVRALEGTVAQPDSLYLKLAFAVSSLLETPPPATPAPPFTSSLALVVYGKGLEHFLAGEVEEAVRDLSQARRLDANSALIRRTLQRAEYDLAGAGLARTLVATFRQILDQPLPAKAAADLLDATQDLLAPPPPMVTGTESSNPYKPPRDLQ